MPIAIATLLLVVPGACAVGAVVGPGRLGLPTRLALVWAMGVAVTGLVAFALAVAGLLRPPVFFPVLGLVSVALLALGLRRGSLLSRARALRDELRNEPLVLGAGLAVLAGFAILRLTFPSELHLSSSTPWRYWADAVEIARLGRFPARSLQFGGLLPAVTNKGFLSGLDAGLGLAIGTEPLPAMAALSWIGAVGLATSLWALGRELGLRFTAALVPLLVVADRVVLNTEITRDLDQFRAETFGRLVAVAALALAVHALRSGDRGRWAIVAGLLFGVGAAIHMVPVAIGLAAAAWFALGRLIVERERTAVLRTAAATAVVAAIVATGLLLSAGGDVGLSGSASDRAIAAEFPPGFDPTLFLKTGAGSEAAATGGTVSGSPARPWSISPPSAVRQYVASATGLHLRGWERSLVAVLAAILFGGGLAAVVALLLRRARLAPIALMAWGLAVTIAGLAWLLSLRSRYYVPATFGPRRLFDYSSIPLILAGLALVEAALPRLRAREPIAAALALAAAVAILPTAHAPASDRSLIGGFAWLRGGVPCDATILPNLQTEGVFEALAGRASRLEGPIPYLRPDALPGVIRTLLDARRYWVDPVHNANLLQDPYVVVIKAGAVGYGATLGHPDVAALDEAPNLEAVFRSPGMDVYRAVGLPYVPAEVVGFECREGPIPASPFRGI